MFGSIDTNTKQLSKHIAQKQIFFFKLPELDPVPDMAVKFPDPDPQHCCRVLGKNYFPGKFMVNVWCLL
jgi:hypothetical protein